MEEQLAAVKASVLRTGCVRLPAHWLWQEPVLPNPAISNGAQTGGNKAILIVPTGCSYGGPGVHTEEAWCESFNLKFIHFGGQGKHRYS